MKVALICLSNMFYMPFLNSYESLLKKNSIEYDIINWDRFQIEDEKDPLKYRDKKIGYQRSFFDYNKYKKFIINRLNLVKYDKIIVFGIQLTFFLRKILKNNFRGNYIIDIRDYNRIIKFFSIKKAIDNSALMVISSPGYKKWLPNSDKYLISHNTQINDLTKLKEINLNFINNEKINISYIGSIRDSNINIEFINSMKNDSKFDLYFHGEGTENIFISNHLNKHNIKNVFLTGRYNREYEEKLYDQSDLISILVPNNDINGKTLLPNRLYNAVLHGKPIISFKDTYLSEQVSKYHLGIVLKDFNNANAQIEQYLINFNLDEYKKGRVEFFKEIIKDKNFFDSRFYDCIMS